MRSVPTRSDARPLREARDALVADDALRGESFGRALASLLDGVFARALTGAGPEPGVVVCALGSYGRREQCPESDVDVLLVHGGSGAERLADALWYPLWDAGFVLGHAARTRAEALEFADHDVDGLTAMLDLRVVAGDARAGDDLLARVRELAQRRRSRVVARLAAAASARASRPGPIAEMLEPNLKDGAGGLRDVQSLAWAGWAHGEPGGVATLVERGYLRPSDPAMLARARTLLLDVRVALHRSTARARDVLALEDQDGVARDTDFADADDLVRALGGCAREVAWIADDAWERLRSAERGPLGRLARRDRRVADGVVVRDGRIVVEADAVVDASLVLRAAVAAAQRRVPIDRPSLERLADAPPPVWGDGECQSFFALLRAGRDALPVIDALDHTGLVARLLPEWGRVRSLPQRNAYHRYTVDRHLLETVAECAALFDDDGFDGDVARACDGDLLLLGALLHDVAKGCDGDHALVGAAIARDVGARLGLTGDSLDTLTWLVTNHLVLAETATRRDLSDDTTISRVADLAATPDRLALLYLLTVADSRATGPAAWSASKAALVRELFVKARAALEGPPASTIERRDERRDGLAARVGAAAVDLLDGLPDAYAASFDVDELARHVALRDRAATVVEWDEPADDRVRCTVVARDRPGLLAKVATALALDGLDVCAALAFTHRDARALDVFTVVDRFGRLADAAGRTAVARRVTDALDEDRHADEDAALRDHVRRYARKAVTDAWVRVEIDVESAQDATIVEVHAPDRLGLLAQLAQVLDRAGLDVRVAKVETMADRVVDVFYVRDRDGAKPTDPARLDALRVAVETELTTV